MELSKIQITKGLPTSEGRSVGIVRSDSDHRVEFFKYIAWLRTASVV
jgi:hypothetical protein